MSAATAASSRRRASFAILGAEIDADDAPPALSDERADLARPRSDADNRITDRRRERLDQLPIARLALQLVEEAGRVPARDTVGRGAQAVPGHDGILSTDGARHHRAVVGTVGTAIRA